MIRVQIEIEARTYEDAERALDEAQMEVVNGGTDGRSYDQGSGWSYRLRVEEDL